MMEEIKVAHFDLNQVIIEYSLFLYEKFTAHKNYKVEFLTIRFLTFLLGMGIFVDSVDFI